MAKRIAYQKGYKYQLANDYYENIGIALSVPIKTDWIILDIHGNLTVKKGYAWDGASGSPDVESILRGSLVHDALYQLMRMNLLDRKYKIVADKLLRQHCIEDDMIIIVADLVYKAVQTFGTSSTLSKNAKPILYAPKRLVA